MSGPNDFQAIVSAILNNQLFRIAPTSAVTNDAVIGMLVGAGLESDWRINAPGGGAWQITDLVTFSTSDVNAAVTYMFPRYIEAASADQAQPASAGKFADIAYKAERPRVPYAQSQGQDRVDSVYHTVVTNYGTAGGQAGVDTVIGGNLPGAGFLQPVLSFLGQLTDIRLWRSLGWIGLGLLLLIVGMIIWFSGSRTASTVAGVAGRAV